jgi:hypothetical protein
MVAYVRTVKTASGATVQIVWSSRRGSRSIEHVGSAHNEAELAALEVTAAQRLAAGQVELDLGLAGGSWLGAVADRVVVDESALGRVVHGLRVVGFWSVTQGDRVFRDRVLGPDRRTDEQGRCRAGAGRGRCQRGVVCHRQASVRYRSMPNPRGGSRWPWRALRMPGFARRRWCSTT